MFVPAIQMSHIVVCAHAERAQEQGEEGQPVPRVRQVVPGE